MAFSNNPKIKKVLKYTAYTLVSIFALIGMVFTGVFFGMRAGLFNVKGSIAGRNQFFLTNTDGTKKEIPPQPCNDNNKKVCDWNETPEWTTVSGGLTKDQVVINKVAEDTGVQARMIAAVVTPEQTRFFTANREVWKSYFEPLKVLISLSKFSLGVSGIKQETAVDIEKYANDPTSPFYPGDGIAALIAYQPGTDHDKELYSRLTNEKDHYYQYIYTAIYIKEVEAQWQKSGIDITHNPETVVTLFNIGFVKSIPHADPSAGGAGIQLGGKTVIYGQLGADFYHSNELLDIFPNN